MTTDKTNVLPYSDTKKYARRLEQQSLEITTKHHQHQKCTSTEDKISCMLTLTSMLLIFVDDLRIGRPTSDGKICAGKLAPLKPHLTNYKNTTT